MFKIYDKESGLIIRYEFKDSEDTVTSQSVLPPNTTYYSNSNRTSIAGITDEYTVVTKSAETSTYESFTIVGKSGTYYVGTGVIETYSREQISVPCEEWREELYRQALLAQTTNSVYNNYYDSEMIAEWRKLYDPSNSSWANGWNPDVYNNPKNLDFWIDFIDTDTDLGKYSIQQIGRRTKVVNNDDIKSIYNKEVPDVVFIENTDDMTTQARQDIINKYKTMGQQYFFLTSQYYDLFSISTTGTSCFDEIRDMLYQHLNYNTTISLTCLPKYYMEPNNIIYVEAPESGVVGNYQITQFSLPLAYNGTMSITATEVLTRV